MKLRKAAELVESKIAETLMCCGYPLLGLNSSEKSHAISSRAVRCRLPLRERSY